MSRARNQTAATLLSLTDVADDTMADDILSEAPYSNQENLVPANSLLHKSRPAIVNSRARQAITKKPVISKSRVAMTRKPIRREVIEQEDTLGVEDIDELDVMEAAPTPSPQKNRVKAVQRAKATSFARTAPSRSREEAVEHKYPVRQSPRKQAQKANGIHAAPRPFSELQSDGVDAGGMSEVDFVIEELAQPVNYGAPPVRARSTSQQPIPTALNRHRRAGSTSSNEGRNPDPTLRRKLGELTAKFEALEVKYRKLHDAGVTEAKITFDKLKASSDEKTRISNDLVKSLKQELAAQKETFDQAQTRVREADSHKTILADLRAQLTAAKKEISELKIEKTELKSELVEVKSQTKSHAALEKQLSESKSLHASLTKQLSEAHRENTNLQAKLATARAANTDRQAPGSAIKGGARVPVMKVMTTTAESAAALQEAQSRIDLYSDLTGLLVRSVERRSDEHVDIFDCIQTGRNGTLHFKLSISTDPAEPYDEAEFKYLPQLDAARDKALMDLLPYFLVEEIEFPRREVSRFYARVSDILTRIHDGDQQQEGEEESDEVDE